MGATSAEFHASLTKEEQATRERLLRQFERGQTTDAANSPGPAAKTVKLNPAKGLGPETEPSDIEKVAAAAARTQREKLSRKSPAELEQEKRFTDTLEAQWRAMHQREPPKGDLVKMVTVVREMLAEQRRAGDDPFREHFYRLMQLASTRLGVSPNEFRTPLQLGRDLAADAKTYDELEAAKALVCRPFAGSQAFDQFMRECYAPKLAELFENRLRCCRECSTIFCPTDRRDQYCSPQCSARARGRKRVRVGNGKSAVENAFARREQWWKRHKPKCSDCRAERLCSTAEAKWQTLGSLPFGADVGPEEAESMMQRDGRTPKRSTEPAPRRSRKALTGSR